MPIDKDGSADELGRAFSALLKASRTIPDLVDLWRAVAAVNEQDRLRSEDEKIDEWEQEAADEDEVPKNDPTRWFVRAHALLLSSNIRYGLDWQRLVARRSPALRHCLEDYEADEDPLPEVRSALIDAIRSYLQEVAELLSDHGKRLQQELEKLSRDLLPDESGACAPGSDKRPRRARVHP